MKIKSMFLRLAVLLSCATAIPAFADSLYSVQIDTSSIAGTTGYLEFQLAPGPGSQGATVALSGFSSDASLGASTPSGNVAGQLPATVSVVNGPGQFNDYLQSVTFGNQLAYNLLFSGPAVNAPGNAPSGSTFAFSLFDNNFNPLLTSDADGFLFAIQITSAGETVVNSSAVPASALNISGTTTVIPEPATWMGMVFGLFALSFLPIYRWRFASTK